jgi:DNA polymerase III subunit gamma/tau
MSEQRFLVTARKYRPLLFNELVAQEHVAGTLKNAIRLDRLAHAYLFTGPRGVGKTTAARILAKAINCTTPAEDRVDNAEPCRVCDSCVSFEQGRNLNIIEIDAASNNKVDDVRDLRETVRIPPQGNRKKVYIVDEVHMLTNQAFNALLKTLEEPPPHVLFIFATTEPHKVLPTIQSRCQRFDFRRIPVQEIIGRLQSICDSENVTTDDGSLMLIARKGDGALRDALSVFDQAVSLCGFELVLDRLVEALGVVGEELFFEVTDYVAANDVAAMLGLVDRIVSGGYDLQEFLDGLAEHLRNILVARTMPDQSLIEASEASRQRYKAVAGSLTENQVLRLLATIDQTMDSLRTARQPRLRLELALIRMASMPATTDLREALRQISTLASAGPAPKSSAAAPPPETRTRATAAPAETQSQPQAQPSPKAPAEVAAKKPRASETPVQTPPAQAADGANSRASAAPAPAKSATASPPESAPAPPPEPAPSAVPAQAVQPDGSGTLDIFGKPALGKPLGSRALGSPALGHPALDNMAVSPSAGDAEPSDYAAGAVAVLEAPPVAAPIEGWDAIVESVMASKIHLGALLHHAHADLRIPSTLTLLVPDQFHVRVLHEAKSEILAGLEEQGHPGVTNIEYEINGHISAESATGADQVEPQEALRKICEEYPAMALLMERFGGEIVW